MTLIDGKAVSAQIKQEIAAEVEQIVAAGGKRPHLAAILTNSQGGGIKPRCRCGWLHRSTAFAKTHL